MWCGRRTVGARRFFPLKAKDVRRLYYYFKGCLKSRLWKKSEEEAAAAAATKVHLQPDEQVRLREEDPNHQKPVRRDNQRCLGHC